MNILHFKNTPSIKLGVYLSLFAFGMRVAGNVVIGDIVLLFVFLFLLIQNLNFSYREVVVFFIFSILSITSTLAGNPIDLSSWVKDFFQLSFYLIACSFIVKEVYLRYEHSDVYHALSIAGFIVATLGILQYLAILIFDINIFSFISIWGGKDAWAENYIRVTSITQHYNHLPFILTITLYFSLSSKQRFISIIILLGIIASGSRTGIVMSFFLIYINLLKSKNPIYIFAPPTLFSMFIISYLTELDVIVQRFSFLISGEIDGSTRYRLELWGKALNILSEFPVFGIGLGQLKATMSVDNLESSIMQILVSFGYLGFGIIFLFLLRLIYRLLYKDVLAATSVIIMIVQLMFHPFVFQAVVGPYIFLFLFFCFQLANEKV